MSDTKTVTRVRIEYADSTYIELTDPEGCKRWDDMVRAQAGIAYVHGMTFKPLPWIEGTRHSENDE